MKIKSILTASAISLGSLMAAFAQDAPKYVFYFIGDGMGLAPVAATEQYRRLVLHEDSLLLMNRFPVASYAYTYSANRPITDSAAAGTALSTGFKTNNGMIAMNPDTVSVTSIANQFKDKGYGVGIVTNVAPDDATPSVFYAHVPKRSDYYTINRQFPDGKVDFLAGSSLRGAKDSDGNKTDIYDYYKSRNVAVAHGLDELKKVDYKKADKVVLVDKDPFQSGNIGYTIDSVAGRLTLVEITNAAVDYLRQTSPDKFFLMVEGGAIDHALHGNDAMTAITDIMHFNDALRIAYDFMLQHPDETLIVVTADHDTGGLSTGYKSGYHTYFNYLGAQKVSKEMFSDYCEKLLKSETAPTWEQMEQYLRENLGFWTTIPLKEKDTKELQKDFHKVFVDHKGKSEKTLYNDFNNFAAEVWELLSKKAQIGFTTRSHTGNPVPVYAVGVGQDEFKGLSNNIDLPNKIRKIAKLTE